MPAKKKAAEKPQPEVTEAPFAEPDEPEGEEDGGIIAGFKGTNSTSPTHTSTSSNQAQSTHGGIAPTTSHNAADTIDHL